MRAPAHNGVVTAERRKGGNALEACNDGVVQTPTEVLGSDVQNTGDRDLSRESARRARGKKEDRKTRGGMSEVSWVSGLQESG